jgi:hypothetical protein
MPFRSGRYTRSPIKNDPIQEGKVRDSRDRMLCFAVLVQVQPWLMQLSLAEPEPLTAYEKQRLDNMMKNNGTLYAQGIHPSQIGSSARSLKVAKHAPNNMFSAVPRHNRLLLTEVVMITPLLRSDTQRPRAICALPASFLVQPPSEC